MDHALSPAQHWRMQLSPWERHELRLLERYAADYEAAYIDGHHVMLLIVRLAGLRDSGLPAGAWRAQLDARAVALADYAIMTTRAFYGHDTANVARLHLIARLCVILDGDAASRAEDTS